MRLRSVVSTLFALLAMVAAIPAAQAVTIATANGGQTVTGIQNLVSGGKTFNVAVVGPSVSFNAAFGGEIPFFAVNPGAAQFAIDLAAAINASPLDPTSIGSLGAAQALIPTSNWATATATALGVVASGTNWFAAVYAPPAHAPGGLGNAVFTVASGPLLVVTLAVPEPATATLGLLGLSGLMLRRRRMA